MAVNIYGEDVKICLKYGRTRDGDVRTGITGSENILSFVSETEIYSEEEDKDDLLLVIIAKETA